MRLQEIELRMLPFGCCCGCVVGRFAVSGNCAGDESDYFAGGINGCVCWWRYWYTIGSDSGFD